MAHLALSLLGPFQATLDECPLAGFESDKARALLAYLAVEAERAHPREKLAALIWPEWPDESARTRLRNTLANLRQILRDADATSPFLRATRETIQLNPASDHWLDARAFADLITAERWQEAAALYRGEFLEGLALKDSVPFEDWALLTRERLRGLYLTALRRLAGQREQRGDSAGAEECLRRVLELEPWDEEAQRALMRALAASGQRSAALAQYEKCVEALRVELGAQPEPATTQLAEQIRAGQGETGKERPGSRLPTPLLPLIGREGELGQLLDALRDPGCRLLSLVGPGGCGKTRLALEAAAKLDGRFARGVHYVPLSAAEAEGIVPAIAQAIGFSLYGEGDVPAARQLSDYLRDKELLLILDTYEHLLAAAPVAVEILEAAPRVKMLVTSRARLNVPGEQCLMLEGIAYPAPTPGPALTPSPSPKGGGETAAPAVQLFLENARRVRRDYEPSAGDLAQIAQVCCCVEGMPLAILLASSWMELLSPGEIATQMAGEDGQRLDLLEADWAGASGRQRSMRAVFDQSWRLLSAREQGILAALAVFPGGFTVDAAREAVGATLRDLLRFVDRSLLQRMSAGRYGMQDLLRRYALERLHAQPGATEAAQSNHAAYYARAMHSWREGFYNARQAETVREMDAEIGNIRAAWRWALARERVQWLSQMVDPLWLYHLRRGRYEEGRQLAAEGFARLMQHAQAAPEDGAALVVAALVRRAEGGMNHRLGHPETAWQAGQEALSLLEKAERLGQEVRAHKARTLRFLGGWLCGWLLRSRYQEAQRLFERSLALCQEAGDRWGVAHALFYLSHTAIYAGSLDQAKEWASESLRIRRELGNLTDIGNTLLALGFIAHKEGRLDEAERCQREGIAAMRESDDQGDLAIALPRLCALLVLQGRFAEAEAIAREDAALLEEMGNRPRLAGILSWLGDIQMHLGRDDEARECAARALKLAEDSAPSEAAVEPRGLALGCLASLALREGRYMEAERLFREAEAITHQITPEDAGSYLDGSGYAALCQERPADAARYFRALLSRVVEEHLFLPALFALPGVALWLAERGEKERAAELFALSRRYPYIADSRWFEEVAGRDLRAIAAALPPAVREAAEERGRARDFWATIRDLLAELANGHAPA